MILRLLKCGALLTIISVFATSTAFALGIFGAGASFPYPLFARWVDTYKKETGNSVNYQSLGSGAGIKMIKDQSVTFGASDQPLKAEELDAAGLIQWPQIIGAIVLVVNLDGVALGDLTLSGEVVAKIFLREITSWDDAAIKKLNPDTQARGAADHCDPSCRHFGHDLQLHELSVEGLRGLEGQGGRRFRRRVARRRGRQGQ